MADGREGEGEHRERGWDRMRPDEPLAEGRQEAAEENASREGSGDAGARPGMTPEMEEQQRRSRMGDQA